MAENRKPKVGLLVVDLDNTLWDWVSVTAKSLKAVLDELILEEPSLDEVQLKEQIRTVHQSRGTTEYSFLLDEIPSLKKYLVHTTAERRFGGVIHAQNHTRFHEMSLYPNVLSTLMKVRQSGVTIVAYTESMAYWVEWRIRRTGLDGVIDYLYSAPDHDFPHGMSPRKVRKQPADRYGLKKTVHLHLARSAKKPNATILAGIVNAHAIKGLSTVYVGDSLTKDVAMAKDAGVLDVHALCGLVPPDSDDYKLLRELTHWSDEQISQEIPGTRQLPTPTFTLHNSFAELLDLFTFGVPREPTSLIEVWRQTVSVQQHFNDICWRIRSLALTALTFVLTATGFVYVNLASNANFNASNSASLVPFIGVFLWCAFWFMDSTWYHKLLKGAVTEGQRLERRLQSLGVDVALGASITDSSHDTVPGNAWRLVKSLVPQKASARLHVFYGLIAGILVVVGLILWLVI